MTQIPDAAVQAVRRQAFEEAASRLIDLAEKAREMEKRLHAKQHDGKYGDRKKQHFYEEKKHFKRLSIGYYKSARVIRSLSSEPAQGEQWRDINSAPSDTVVLMAWKDTYQGIWGYEAGIYHSTKGGWRHGSATHWMPLPAAPTTEAGRAALAQGGGE